MLDSKVLAKIYDGRERAAKLLHEAGDAESSAYTAYIRARNKTEVAKDFYSRLCGFNGFLWQVKHSILTHYSKKGDCKYHYYKYYLRFGQSCENKNYLYVVVQERPEKKRDKWQVRLGFVCELYTHSGVVLCDSIDASDAKKFIGEFNFKTLDAAEQFAREKITEFNEFFRTLHIYNKTVEFLGQDIDALDDIPALKDAGTI